MDRVRCIHCTSANVTAVAKKDIYLFYVCNNCNRSFGAKKEEEHKDAPFKEEKA